MTRAALAFYFAAFVMGDLLIADTPSRGGFGFSTAPIVVTPSQLSRIDYSSRTHPDHRQQESSLQRRLTENPSLAAVKEELVRLQAARQRLEKSPITVHLTQRVYRLNEPIHAYFTVQNRSHEPLGLDMRLDLHLRHRTTNSCKVTLERIDGKHPPTQPRLIQHQWECGGPPTLTLPANGYYCTRADLRLLGAHAPGQYRIHWNYANIVSPERHFTVLPSATDAWMNETAKVVAVAKIVSRSVDRQSQTLTLQQASLTPLSFPRFAAALAVGADHSLYPDAMDLPEQDRFVAAHLSMHASHDAQSPSRLTLTLTPRQRNKGLYLENIDNIYLLAVTSGNLEKPAVTAEAVEQLKTTREYSLADPGQPLRIEIDMQPAWHHQFGLTSAVELHVIISGKQVRLQGQWPESQRVTREVEGPGAATWRGLLRTPALRVTLPSARK